MTRPISTLFALALAVPLATQASAEDLVNDNLNVIGNACIGPQCVAGDGDAAPYNGIIIKSAVPKILFDSGNSTVTDWSLTGSATNGGARDFALSATRVTGGTTTPFLINGQSPDSSFVVEPAGVGFGTSLPQRELHVVDGVGATLRLEQDASEGNGSQIWDVQVSDFGFQLVDVGTILSLLPFTVENGARTHSLYLTSGNRVGMGTSTPAAALHVQRTDGSAGLLVENTAAAPVAAREMFAMRNNGGSYFTLDNTNAGTTWFFTHEQASPNRFIIADAVADGPEFTLTAGGDVTIPGNFISGNTTLNVPDYVFAEDYALRPLSEVASFIDAHSHLPDVPSAAEIADTGLDMTAMQMALLKKVEELTLYTLEQEAELTRLRGIEARLAQIETLLQATR
ncbi:hypothetical protein ACOXXX_18250 [Thalassococcus sp. BH17M4-6]|uniref:hypothetical protein n=1 Tax=Thalassococcus sp. BH17M4-6 TaxID=3413148 RepID=UPI003BE45FC1